MKTLFVAVLVLGALTSGIAQAAMGILTRSEMVSYDGPLWRCTYRVGSSEIARLIHAPSCPYSMDF